MRKIRACLLALCCLSALSIRALGQSPREIIDKSIKAMWGQDKLGKLRSFQVTQKGTMDEMGNIITGTSETYIKLADELKDIQCKRGMELNVNGIKQTQVQIMNKDKITVSMNGVAVPLSDAMRQEIKQQMHAEFVSSLLPLKDKRYTLSALPEAVVHDHPAVGVKVSTEGYRDVSLYFDKETGLPVKRAYRATDPRSNQECLMETYCSDYKEFEGVKMPARERVERDGKRFLETELVAVKRVDRFDDKVFEN